MHARTHAHTHSIIGLFIFYLKKHLNFAFQKQGLNDEWPQKKYKYSVKAHIFPHSFFLYICYYLWSNNSCTDMHIKQTAVIYFIQQVNIFQVIIKPLYDFVPQMEPIGITMLLSTV